MNKYKVVGTAIFTLAEDQTGELFQGTLVAREEDGVLWLVANWLVSNDTGAKLPAQLIPLMRLVPQMTADPREWLLGTAIPKALLTYPIPPELRREFGVVDAEGVADIPGPKSIH